MAPYLSSTSFHPLILPYIHSHPMIFKGGGGGRGGGEEKRKEKGGGGEKKTTNQQGECEVSWHSCVQWCGVNCISRGLVIQMPE